MPDPATQEIEIFRAGRHVAVDGTEVNVSHADLAAIADAYDPTLGEAPFVVGHPKINAPAYGWAKSLAARDGILFASPHQVDEAFSDLVKAGRFKKRSASFFMPQSPGNPKPGGMYLRHVGWLGAAAPAVTGLRDVSFAADDEGVLEFAASTQPWVFRQIADVFRRMRDRFIEQDGVEKTDELLPTWMIEGVAEAGRVDDTAIPSFAAPITEPVMPEQQQQQQQQTADFAARDAALTTRQTEIDAREKALRDKEAKAHRAEVVEFAAGLVKAGKLLPRQQTPIVEMLITLESADAPQSISFAAADGSTTTATTGAALRTFLGELPVQVDFAERGAGDDIAESSDFAAPSNTQVDPARLAIHAKAKAYQRAHPNTSWAAAVRAAGG